MPIRLSPGDHEAIYGQPPGQAVAVRKPDPQPIGLPPLGLWGTPRPKPPKAAPGDYQPGPLVRGLMRLTDRAGEAVAKGPTPFAPEQAPGAAPPVADLIEQVRTVMDAIDARATVLPSGPGFSSAPGLPPVPASGLQVAVAFGSYVVQVGDAVTLCRTKAELRTAVLAWVDGL
jgi:hypothetical protein